MKIAIDRIHVFAALTARWQGLRSRVTLNNKTPEAADITVTIRCQDGSLLEPSTPLQTLPPGANWHSDLDRLLQQLDISADRDEEQLFIFGMVPASLREGPPTIDLEPGSLMQWTLAQDHYIEHYDSRSGFSAGVLYQTPPINPGGSGRPGSFLMQAPKVFLSAARRTCFQVHHYSCNDDYGKSATMRCRVRDRDGDAVAEWDQQIEPHALRYIDVYASLVREGVEPLEATDKHGFLYFEAACDHATFVPLTWNVNRQAGTFNLEHSLPPYYYGRNVRGETRDRMIAFAMRPQIQRERVHDRQKH